MLCNYSLINGSRQHFNLSNEQKVKREPAASVVFVVVQNDVRAQQYKRHLFQKEDQKAPDQKMTWFPANIQKGTRMSDRVRPVKPVPFYQDNNKGNI